MANTFHSECLWRKFQGKYLIAQLRIVPVLELILIMGAVVAGCVGYTPPVIPPTEPPPVSATIRPTRTARATPTFRPVTPLPSPTSSLGLKLADLQGETIRFWYVYGMGQVGNLNTLIAKFNQSNPWGINVEGRSFQDYTELVDEARANIYGELPDLAAIYPYQAVQLSGSGGFLVDLALYVADQDWGFKEGETQDFYPLFWSQDMLNGRRTGIPFYRIAQALYYNSTWAGELGFSSPPETPQEFQAQVCAAAQSMHKTGGARPGGWVLDTDPATLLGWIYAFSGEVLAPDGQGYRFDGPEILQALTFLRQLADQGCAWASENQSPRAEFAGRKALAIAGNLTGLSTQHSLFISAGNQDQWTVIPYPSPQGRPAIVVYGPSLSIFRSTPERQLAAWLFLRWLVSLENQASLVRSSGVLPVRTSVSGLLADYQQAHPQWVAAINLLPYARLEPGYASWKTVRLILGDAGRQLFTLSFQVSDIPALIETLDVTAAEIHSQTR